MENLKRLVKEYLKIFPEECERQKEFLEYLNDESNIYRWNDWNNFSGHMVAGGFIYSKKEKKILMIYHKDLKMYLHPGGHVDKTEADLLDTAIREIYEEVGLKDLKLIFIADDKAVPFDIDTHKIEYNKRLNLPEHYHFEFRYLFEIDEIIPIHIDENEISEYVWKDIDELKNDVKYEKCYKKLKKYIEV